MTKPTSPGRRVNILPMATPRFYCELPLAAPGTLDLPDDVAHHIRVRRLRVGDPIELFDGNGHVALAHLTQLDKKSCTVSIQAQTAINVELKGQITLVQGLANQDKMDWIIEKATELGVTRLLVVQAQRSVVKLSGERAQRRAEHGRRIIESASEQCGRNTLMELQLPITLTQALQQCQHLPKLACLPSPDTRPLQDPDLLASLTRHQGCAIFIGPEGGWDPQEVQAMQAAQAINTSLGPRVLRTETAGLAAVAAITALMHW